MEFRFSTSTSIFNIVCDAELHVVDLPKLGIIQNSNKISIKSFYFSRPIFDSTSNSQCTKGKKIRLQRVMRIIGSTYGKKNLIFEFYAWRDTVFLCHVSMSHVGQISGKGQSLRRFMFFFFQKKENLPKVLSETTADDFMPQIAIFTDN